MLRFYRRQVNSGSSIIINGAFTIAGVRGPAPPKSRRLFGCELPRLRAEMLLGVSASFCGGGESLVHDR